MTCICKEFLRFPEAFLGVKTGNVVFSLTLVCTVSLGDSGSHWVSSKLNVHEANLKFWHNYIEKYLSIGFEQQDMSSDNFVCHILDLTLKAKTFQYRSFEYSFEYYKHIIQQLFTTRTFKQKTIFFEADNAYFKESVKTTSLRVKRVCAHLQMSSDMFSFHKIHISYSHLYRLFVLYASFVWHFELDKTLSLNLTFKDITFIAVPVNFENGSLSCEFGSLKVSKFRSSTHFFAFCGQQSIFSFYPPFRNFVATTFVNIQTTFTVEAFISVLDYERTIKSSVPCRTCSPEGGRHWTDPVLTYKIPIVENLYTSSIFHIQVPKIKHIVIFSHLSERLLVLDGPGFLSQEIKPKDLMFILSSFCSIIQQLLKSSNMSHNSTFSYLSTSSEIKHFSFSEISSLFIPSGSICQTGNTINCLFQINASQQRVLNVTVLNILYEGKPSGCCRFGGFTTGEISNGSYCEKAILCQNHGRTLNASRSFYSYGSSMIIILYLYKPYSNITVEISVNSTNCRHIELNICSIFLNCSVLGAQSPPKALCSKFYDKLRGTNISPKEVSLAFDEDSMTRIETHVKLFKDTCITIQQMENFNCPYRHKHSGFDPELNFDFYGFDMWPIHTIMTGVLHSNILSSSNILVTLKGAIEKKLQDSKMQQLSQPDNERQTQIFV